MNMFSVSKSLAGYLSLTCQLRNVNITICFIKNFSLWHKFILHIKLLPCEITFLNITSFALDTLVPMIFPFWMKLINFFIIRCCKVMEISMLKVKPFCTHGTVKENTQSAVLSHMGCGRKTLLHGHFQGDNTAHH